MSSFGNPGMFGQGNDQPIEYGAGAGSPVVASFFNAVYAWMCAGLGLTAGVAWWVASQPDMIKHIFSGGTILVLFLAQIILVGVIASATKRLSATAATFLFLVYAALNGLTLSCIFLIYTASSIAGTFVACAAMFGAMSLYGALTKADLSGLGKVMFMLLIGLIISSVVNFFLASPMLTWLISYGGVVVFAGLTAYDTQRLRGMAIATAGDQSMAARYSIVGALVLYLDFLNLFLFLLQILGDRRR
jgi:uncharacterized protein